MSAKAYYLREDEWRYALIRASDGVEIACDGGEPEDATFTRDYAPVVDELNRIAPLEAENVALRAALLRYGAHDHECPAEMPSPLTGKDQGCSCGLVEMWAALDATRVEP